jgi:biotin carboxylase
MNVLLLSPGFPVEMPYFTRGLAEVGASVVGVGDQPEGSLPDVARRHLSHYLHVRSLWDEAQVIEEVRALARRVTIDRIECLWEPAMILAGRLREAIGLPGMTAREVLPFRDKEVMKQVLDAAGVRTPRHHRASTANQVRQAAADVGYPLIVKPIAGAGSADTHRVNDARELEAVLPLLVHVPEVSVEEFIDGEEYTFDTITIGGEIAYFNICWYRPRPLIARTVEWISPQTVALRDVDAPFLEVGKQLGCAVLAALRYSTGFTHMEWFRKPDGEAVFGEIAARPPGARTTDLMNYASDIDVFRGWAEAVACGRLTQRLDRKYNAAMIFKRASGNGRIRRIDGLERILAAFGPHIAEVSLLPVGAPRRNWKQSLLSDGQIVLRHPDLRMTVEMADRVGVELRMEAEP